MRKNYMNEIELERYNEFQLKHCGVIEIIITPTGISDKVELRCKGCNERIDISDYDSW